MKSFFILLFFISTIFASDATIEIVKKIEKIPTIVVANSSDPSMDTTLNNKLLKLLIGDIKVSSHFKVDDNVISSKYDGSDVLGSLKSELMLKVKLSKEPSGRLSARVKLLNAKNGSKIYEKSYAISKGDRYPFLAHNIAIDLNDKYGAPSIDWMRKYIIFAKYVGSGKSNIVVADYTLSFMKTIVKGGLNIFPKWADHSQESFYYTSYNSGKPTLYKLNVYSGQKTKILSSNGMIVCSDVSRDGNRLLITMAPKDQPDIYLYNVNTGSKRKITKYRGIDVGGNFVDGDSGVVFISERLGYPNIFHKSLNGGKVEQMVYHGKNNSSCTTFGKYIVYSSRESMDRAGRGTFNLYLISTQTDSIRKLTNGGKNMFPRFADDGETILFIKNSLGSSNLGVLRLNANKSFLFPLNVGKIQSIDW
jgi:TolB protein